MSRPRGAFNIPKDGAVLFICGPHANQFLDPLLLFSEVRKEAHRRVAVLIAAKVGEIIVVGDELRGVEHDEGFHWFRSEDHG